MGIFLMVWVSVFWLHSLSLFNIREVSSQSYQLLLLSVFSLFMGYVLFRAYDIQTPIRKTPTYKIIIVNERALLLLITCLVSIQLFGAFIIFYEITYQLGGVETFFNRPLAVRQYVVGVQNGYENVRLYYKFGNYLTNIGFLSCIFGGIYFSSFSKYRAIGLIPIISLLISQLLTLGRYKFVSGLVFFIISYLVFTYFLSPRKRSRRIIELTILGILSIIFVGTISYYVLKFRSPLEIDITYLLKKSLYLYFTGGVTAFENFLNSDITFLYGESSFRSITKWLARFNLWDEEQLLSVHNTFTNVTPTYRMNTYTFAKSLYEDFGIYGLVAFPFIWGAVSYRICSNTFKNFNFVNLFATCIITFSLLISFFSFYFQTLTTLVFWLIFIVLIDHFFFNKIFKIELEPQGYTNG
ncbi:MAG: oligosaccharide repeat unit polymerase [Balneolaceae bacterium]|nr:oligosaccharide repeat unit polymerase [Balneolaceae bacterium]